MRAEDKLVVGGNQRQPFLLPLLLGLNDDLALVKKIILSRI